MKPRIWYHVTGIDFGDFVVLEPHVPVVFDEPDIPRICVAPNIRCCLAALSPLPTPLYAYVTMAPMEAAMPYCVYDSRITHERWLFHPTIFVKLRVIRYVPCSCLRKTQVAYKREYSKVTTYV